MKIRIRSRLRLFPCKILTLLLCLGFNVFGLTASTALSFQRQPQSILNYRPQKYELNAAHSKVLESVNWKDKKSLDSVKTSDLEKLICSSNVQDIVDLACGSLYHPAINERRTLCLNGNANCIFALWMNTSAVSTSGALIVKEADKHLLYWFRREMRIEDVDGNGTPEIIASKALIYKA